MHSKPAIRPDRTADIDAFIERIGWLGATRSLLAGDASFRRYDRVLYGDVQAVLMDAPPPWEDVKPFIKITHVLRSLGLNAPDIFAADEDAGFLMLEDLGDASFSRVLRAHPEQELSLYSAAISALAMLQLQWRSGVHQEDLAPYDEAVYLREVALFSDWFMPQVVGRARAMELREEFLELWRGILAEAGLQQSVLVHRDYHADNLLWLPERSGVARVGMLDYQDALLGDPFYDVASLLQDARRDVTPATTAACYAQFIEQTDEADVAAAQRRYAVLAAQRNLKIIGIFTRLCVRDGKPHYLQYLPRVWGHVLRDMADASLTPVLMPLVAFMDAYVPADARGVIAIDTSIGSLS